MDEGTLPEYGAAPPAVTTWYVASKETSEQVVRAIVRCHLRRPATWRAWGTQWGLMTLALLGILALSTVVLGLVPPGVGPVSALVAFGLFLALDLVSMPWRVSGAARKVSEAQAPPGTPVKGSFDELRFGFTTPDASHAVSTGAVTRATWTEGCLVLDTSTDKFYVRHGALLTDEAWRVVTRVLGPRLRTL